jgi:hypothetical protein
MNTDPADLEWQPFPATVQERTGLDRRRFVTGAVWLPEAVALWVGGNILEPASTLERGKVQVFDAAPPHALRWEYRIEPLPGATVAPVLVGATAVGDRLVLTTSTGVRVLGTDGALLGGSDPLPCGRMVTAAAAQTAPDTFSVGADAIQYVFDLALAAP